jgi:dihydropteroate synthase
VLKQRIAVDPGIGFGKRREQNSEIIARLHELRALDAPIVAGPSRKHFLKQEDQAGTEFATAAAVAACAFDGVHLVRVHDVKAMRTVLEIIDSIKAHSEQGASAT